ncbi:MAG TPA: 4'-phosphopantetheinyl transferase superfamily protein [Candidatus Enterenecus stercoripullorum]|nr:4'-phosphopantetheinyl transferase superfamily protein [Candidatus Enterenecus stercoripullorum]
MTVIFGTGGGDGRSLSRPLLRRAAELTWGWSGELVLERSPRGKPYFAGRTNRWLSLSHSGGFALCALSDDGPVGVDIEMVRPHRANLPDYVLSPEEKARFDGSWEDFARLWTLKESWCKMQDVSLYPPREVVTPPGCPHRSYGGADWRAAVCCQGVAPEEIRWVWLEEGQA